MNHQEYVDDICKKTKKASIQVAKLSINDKKKLLYLIAETLVQKTKPILEANIKDLANAKANGLTDAMIDRLTLNDQRIKAMADSVKEIAEQDDPIGRVENIKVRPSGIRVGQMRVPIGVVAVVYESRPNVTTDIAALCIKSGNAVILRGGKEAINSNIALYNVIAEVLKSLNYDQNIITLITETDRELLKVLLKRNDSIDIVIPRGGAGLIKTVTEESTIPVIKHDKGLCTIFIDESANLKNACDITINAKVQRPGVCNAVETLLIHSNFSQKKELLSKLLEEKVEIRGCTEIQKIIPDKIKLAQAEDFDAEFLDLIIAVKTVNSLDEAMEHIREHGSGHSEAIITSSYENSERFLKETDSAAVFVNASTRFHDGGEFGLGAEVGISTEKLHARGAMGAEGLTTLKYVVYGNGEIRK